MNTAEHPVNLSVATARQIRLIRLQRVTIAVLLTACIAALGGAKWEQNRAEQWRTTALQLQDTLGEELALEEAGEKQAISAPVLPATTSNHYPVTLIHEDGSKTPLTGKALHIDMGANRLLDISLARQKNNYLLVWAPAKRSDKFFHQTIFRPGCANVFMLELYRHDLKEGQSEAVAYKAPH